MIVAAVSRISEACAGTNTVAALLAGAIDAAAARRLEAHLDRCASCRRVVAELGRGLSAIGAAPGAGGALPQIGERVGRYELVRVIGVGGMGVVYEARDRVLDRRVAVKLLRPDIAAGEALLAEAQAMARLQHPHIAVVHDAGRHGAQLYVCMEYVAGQTLRAWLAERARSWREIVEVFAAAGRGLAYVHAAGLVHRDFKPDNVLIGGGRVVVSDFGLAQLIDPLSGGAARSGTAGPCDRGFVVGTPAYMAPEQRRGERVDARADQYAFCAALREALGRRAPRWLERAIARGLAARPGERFASMDALLAAIAPRPRRLGALAVVAAAGIAAVAAFATGGAPAATAPRVIDRPVIERVVEHDPAPSASEPVAPAAREPTAPAPAVRASDPASPIAPVREAAPVAAPVEAAPAAAPATSWRARPRPALPPLPPPLPPLADYAATPSCDDGSELACARDVPPCPATMVAAVQDGCWVCVDERTCLRRPTAPPAAGARTGSGTRAEAGSGTRAGSGSGSENAICGNGFCELGEDHASCPADCCPTNPDGSCVAVCGNGFCEQGEDRSSCPADCR